MDAGDIFAASLHEIPGYGDCITAMRIPHRRSFDENRRSLPRSLFPFVAIFCSLTSSLFITSLNSRLIRCAAMFAMAPESLGTVSTMSLSLANEYTRSLVDPAFLEELSVAACEASFFFSRRVTRWSANFDRHPRRQPSPRPVPNPFLNRIGKLTSRYVHTHEISPSLRSAPPAPH